MKALSLRQPWASVVAEGLKTIENRSRQHGFSTPFPQRILIHASKQYDPSAPLWLLNAAKASRCWTLYNRLKEGAYSERRCHMGAIIGSCDFIDAGTPDEIRAKYPDDANWIMTDTKWCYVVRNVRTFEPVPYRGLLGFFEVPDSIVGAYVAPF